MCKKPFIKGSFTPVLVYALIKRTTFATQKDQDKMRRWFFFIFLSFIALLLQQAAKQQQYTPNASENTFAIYPSAFFSISDEQIITNHTKSCLSASPSAVEREIRHILDCSNAFPASGNCTADYLTTVFKFLPGKIGSFYSNPVSGKPSLRISCNGYEPDTRPADYYIYTLRRIQV